MEQQQGGIFMLKTKKVDTLRLTQLAILMAITLLLGFSPLGFIMVGPLSITIMHIPVIIGAILLGPVDGGILGLGFGMVSMIKATTATTPGDMLFSPLVSGSPLESLIMAVVPRVILGVLVGLIFNGLRKKCTSNIVPILVSSIVGKIICSVLTLTCLSVFFESFPLKKILVSIMGINCFTETTLGVILALAVCKPLLSLFSKKKTFKKNKQAKSGVVLSPTDVATTTQQSA